MAAYFRGKKRLLGTISTLICSHHFLLVLSRYPLALLLLEAKPSPPALLSVLSCHALSEAFLSHPLHRLAPFASSHRKEVNPGKGLGLNLNLSLSRKSKELTRAPHSPGPSYILFSMQRPVILLKWK